MSVKDWAERHRDMQDWANAVYSHWLRDLIAENGLLAPPPSRTETIHALWSMVSEMWAESSVNGKLAVQTDPTGEEFVFELIRYGPWLVVECSGVVVQKTTIR
jgi:hypothetical protein